MTNLQDNFIIDIKDEDLKNAEVFKKWIGQSLVSFLEQNFEKLNQLYQGYGQLNIYSLQVGPWTVNYDQTTQAWTWEIGGVKKMRLKANGDLDIAGEINWGSPIT